MISCALTRRLEATQYIRVKTNMSEKTKNSWNPWSQSGWWKAHKVWRKGCVEKMNFELLSLEWKREGVMDGDSADEGNDKLISLRVRSDESDKSSWSVGRQSSLGSWLQRQGDAWLKERLLTSKRKRQVDERRLQVITSEEPQLICHGPAISFSTVLHKCCAKTVKLSTNSTAAWCCSCRCRWSFIVSLFFFSLLCILMSACSCLCYAVWARLSQRLINRLHIHSIHA